MLPTRTPKVFAALSAGTACHRTGHRLIGTRLCKLLSSRLKHRRTHHQRLALDPFQFVSLHQVGLESKAVFWAETHSWPAPSAAAVAFGVHETHGKPATRLCPTPPPVPEGDFHWAWGLGLLECYLRRTHCIFRCVIQFWCPSPVF